MHELLFTKIQKLCYNTFDLKIGGIIFYNYSARTKF